MANPNRIRILIVDDEETIRHLLKLALQEDFDILEAADGVEAFDVALRDRPDVIISDIMMPRLDGYGLYRKIKARPETAAVPFVFLSAKKDVDDRVVGLELGADDYITKPFSIKELKAKVRSLTKKMGEIKGRGSLEGLLREVDLLEVIQLIEMGRKTGMLMLESPFGNGEVYFEQGEPVFSRTGRWSGLDAFFFMLTWKEGRFRLEQTPLRMKENVPRIGGQELLMEGVRLADEMGEAQRRMPPDDTVLYPATETITSGEMGLLLQAFAGGATVTDALSRVEVAPHRFYPLVAAAMKADLLTAESADQKKLNLLRRLRDAVAQL